MSALTLSAECPNCLTVHDGLPADCDEDGTVAAVLELRACPACHSVLCPSCPQFACDGCGQAFCGTHVQERDCGSGEPPLRFCPACAFESDLANAEFPALPKGLPPVREVRRGGWADVGVEVA
jgi:hypothetical protein